MNDWLATNSAGVDLLEIYNPTNLPILLSGLIISGKITTPSTSRPIPPLSFIGARGFFSFICDSLAGGKGADHLDFRLSSTSSGARTPPATSYSRLPGASLERTATVRGAGRRPLSDPGSADLNVV